MIEDDARLRTLYRLAEVTEGEALERVLAAVRKRRRELELEAPALSAFAGLPAQDPAPWTPAARPFRPAPSNQVPVRARRSGERGYRIVGTRTLPEPG